MKNQQVKAVLFAMALSTASLAGCASSVYGCAETEAAVYGTFETDVAEVYGSFETDSETAIAFEEDNWELDLPQRDGFAESTNQEVTLGNTVFELPDYMTEESSSADEMEFVAEENDTDFARLTLNQEIRELPDESLSAAMLDMLEELGGEINDGMLFVENYEIESLGQFTRIYVRHATVNGVRVSYYYSLTAKEISDTEAEVTKLYFSMTEGCSYDYLDDFMKIVENAR